MADEKNEIQNIKSERAAAKPVEADPEPKPKRKGRPRKKVEPEPAFKPDQFVNFTSILLDGVTKSLGTSVRPNDEKVALATATCAVANKRIPDSEYGEEVVLAFVAVPIGLSILVEYLTGRKNEEQTRVNPGSVGDGQVNPHTEGVVQP